ncbi:TonB-dependent receptor [Kordiimonas pumila]|uniref:TonB-dependent receptor n=1 Tax=Kordiimonas pumila TaxID=2161677 RepID=A0ABV7D3H5_9PROT|nr:TonB-dependent receptor [Kordiimonas pumila]
MRKFKRSFAYCSRAKVSLIAISSVALLASGEAVFAAGDKGAADFEEITVTASKRGAATVQDTPYNISAIGADTLSQINAVGMDDFAHQIAGLNVLDSGPSNKTIQIRGLSGAAQVSVYLDEVPFLSSIGANVQQTDVALYDMERVEVLRGPQGTLYGAGSQGGTIRYITNKPDSSAFAASVEGDIATRSRDAGEALSLNAMVNVPVIADKLAIRAVGFYRDVDGYVDLPELGAENTNTLETKGGRVQVAFDMSDSTKLSGMIYHHKTEAGDSGNVTEAGDSRLGTIKEPFFDDLTMYNVTLDHTIDAGVFTVTGSLFDREALYVFDVSQFVPPGQSASINQKGPEKNYSTEARFASSFDSPLQLIAGVFYEKHKRGSLSQGFITDPETGLVPENASKFFDTRTDVENTNKAIFGEVSYQVSDRFNIVAGGRLFEMTSWSQTNELATPFGVPGGLADPLSYKSGTKFAGKFQAFYEWSDDVLTYLTFSQGFRRGGPNRPSLQTASGADVPVGYDPDFVDNYEFGWKTQFMDKQLTFNGAVYYMQFKDIQTSLLDSNQAFEYVTNSGKAKLYGIELETVLRPDALEGFSASLNLSLADQTLAEDAVDAATNPEAGRKGERLPDTSPFSAGAVFEQRFEVGGYQASANMNFSYTGKANTTFSAERVASDREWGGFVLANAQFGLRGDNWHASIYAKNIFDKREAVDWVVETRPGIPDRILTTQPRTIGLTLGYDF